MPCQDACLVGRRVVLAGVDARERMRPLHEKLEDEDREAEQAENVRKMLLAMAEDPLSSVVLGAGKMLSDFNLLRKISID